ncbi:MAG: glycosyltransferase family 4 protein [Cellvibrionaceae bacterium]
MNLLIIGYVWPETKSSAAGWHMLSLIRLFLEQSWSVTFASPAQKTEHMDDLVSMGVAVEEIVLNCSSFDEFVGGLNPDIVVFDRFMMEEQFGWRVAQKCPQALRILDTEDLHSLRSARQNAVKKNKIIDDLFLEMATEDITQREVAAIFRSDLTLMISDVEKQLLEERFSVSERQLHYLPFLLDKISPSQKTFEERQHFVVIGNFRHQPNWDSVLWLKQLWPVIRKQLPDAELHIYGAYTPPKATALHNPKQGFLVKGWADDVQAVMARARVCLAPLRFGAGIKGKLVDAMRYGTPNITTSIGIEGIQGDCEWGGLVADNEVDIIDSAVQLYTNKNLWQQKQTTGFGLLSQRFDRETHAQKLLERINSVKATLDNHRKNNFIGSMLLHHHHKSTQYMSQWIETKNKL